MAFLVVVFCFLFLFFEFFGKNIAGGGLFLLLCRYGYPWRPEVDFISHRVGVRDAISHKNVGYGI